MSVVHQILLGGVLIDGAAGRVTFSEIVGWDGLPDARGSSDPIPQAHGSFERPRLWRESRAVSITGWLHESDRVAVELLKRELTNAWEAARAISVTDNTGVWSTVAEVQTVDFPDLGGWAREVPFTIDMILPDPVRYRDWVTAGPAGLPVHEGGLILPEEFPWDFGTSTRPVATVTNGGALPVLPRVTVTGSADSIVVHGGPRRMSFGAFAGDLVLDALDRRAYLNGVDVTRDLVRRDWPVVPAGASQDFYFEAVNPSPDLALTVDYREGTW